MANDAEHAEGTLTEKEQIDTLKAEVEALKGALSSVINYAVIRIKEGDLIVFKSDGHRMNPSQLRLVFDGLKKMGLKQCGMIYLPEGIELHTMPEKDLEKVGLQRKQIAEVKDDKA